jgi:hypothetical protein
MSDQPFRAREIEVRHVTLDDGSTEFDEIVAADAHVHLEKMNDSQFALIVETRNERACFMVGARRAAVDAFTSWHEPINRRSEAQKRRWNRLTPEQRKRRRR